MIQGHKTYSDLAENQWTLAPRERVSVPRAIYLPDELEHITGVHPESTIEMQLDRLKGGEKQVPATTVYELREVYLLNGYLYNQGLKEPIVRTRESLLGWGKCEHIEEAALASTYCGNKSFGHWMSDDLTLGIAAKQLSMPIRTPTAQTPHQREYIKLFDLPALPVRQAMCDKLFVLDDIGQNRFKRERYEMLRSRLKQMHPSMSPPGVMFLRGSSGVRRLMVNELELAAFLERQGFVILDPEKLSVDEIVRRSLGAKIVVGVEGSQIIHGLYTMAAGGTLLTLLAPNLFNNLCKEYTDCLGMNYAFSVGQAVEGGFRIDLDRFARVLDRIYVTV